MDFEKTLLNFKDLNQVNYGQEMMKVRIEIYQHKSQI